MIKNRDFFTKVVEYKTQETPEICVVMPVYNASHIIAKSLNGITKSISKNAHVVLILDNCSDSSESLCIDWFTEQIKKSETFGITIYRSYKSNHETKCDNFAFKNHRASIAFLEVQADIVLNDPNLDLIITKCFKSHPILFAISGRGTHLWQLPYNPKLKTRIVLEIMLDIYRRSKRVIPPQREAAKLRLLELDDHSFFEEWGFGRIGENVESRVEVGRSRKIYLSETVMRGPIAFNSNALRELNYLNERAHPLAGDDHEITLRAWTELSLRSGYMPINYESPLSWGADRRKKPLKEEFNNLYLRFRQSLLRKESKLCIDSAQKSDSQYKFRGCCRRKSCCPKKNQILKSQ